MAETRSQEIQREVISLREHFEVLRRSDREDVDRRFADQEKSVHAALQAADKAVTKAEAAAEKRADASNEIRGAMLDAQKNFPTRAELADIARRISLVEEYVARATGRSSGTALGGDLVFRVIAGISAIMVIAAAIYGFTR